MLPTRIGNPGPGRGAAPAERGYVVVGAEAQARFPSQIPYPVSAQMSRLASGPHHHTRPPGQRRAPTPSHYPLPLPFLIVTSYNCLPLLLRSIAWSDETIFRPA